MFPLKFTLLRFIVAFFFKKYNIFVDFVLTGNDFINWWNDNKNTERFQMTLNVLFGSCLAFGLEVSEYFAVYKTSSITLSVVGIIKVSAVVVNI